MSGISSKALNGTPENKYKFNDGTELNEAFDINLYETPNRSYDPQIGRFHQIDPLIEYAYDWSTYAFANNNPILLNDPSGLFSDSAHKAIVLPEVVLKSQPRPKSASSQVIENNWFIRMFAAREVRNMDRALDAYQRGGLNDYLNTNIRNAHSEVQLEFSTGGYMNPFQKAAKVGGSSLRSIDDVMVNPNLLKGKTPQEVEKIIGNTPGWRIEKLGQGSQKGKGWILRQHNANGNPTGPQIRWHPGGGHHGPDPYWRVVGPNGDLGGIIR